MENKNIIITRTIVEDVKGVCQVRQINNIGCRGCKYEGKVCTFTIDYLKKQVTRPTQIMLNKEEN